MVVVRTFAPANGDGTALVAPTEVLEELVGD